jgi:hypothetical protein
MYGEVTEFELLVSQSSDVKYRCIQRVGNSTGVCQTHLTRYTWVWSTVDPVQNLVQAIKDSRVQDLSCPCGYRALHWYHGMHRMYSHSSTKNACNETQSLSWTIIDSKHLWAPVLTSGWSLLSIIRHLGCEKPSLCFTLIVTLMSIGSV